MRGKERPAVRHLYGDVSAVGQRRSMASMGTRALITSKCSADGASQLVRWLGQQYVGLGQQSDWLLGSNRKSEGD